MARTPADEGIAAARRDNAERIRYGNLERKVDNIDQALYVASCFCGSHGPQVIYCSTHQSVAAYETGERYLVLDESDATRHHLREDQAWEPVYRIEKASK
jgi:hypothetical protein